MKKVRKILMIIWTILAILSPAMMGKYNFDNILYAIILEVFGLAVLGIVFGILIFIVDKIKSSTTHESKEIHPVETPMRKITLRVVSGKEPFHLNEKRSVFIVKQWRDGYVTVSEDPARFEIFDYEWNGPEYKSISKTTNASTTKGKTKEKTKRKGRVTGALIGTAIAPGVGTAIGAAVGTGKKTKGKNASTTTGNSTTVNSDMEIDSYASVKFRNIETNQINVVGFYCNSRTDIELKAFNIPDNSDTMNDVTNQKNSVELLKGYKELLDSGIITQEEFDLKKSELL